MTKYNPDNPILRFIYLLSTPCSYYHIYDCVYIVVEFCWNWSETSKRLLFVDVETHVGTLAKSHLLSVRICSYTNRKTRNQWIILDYNIILWNSMTSTCFVFTELANTIKYGGGFLYNLVFTEWRHCVSQNEIWGRRCYITLFSTSDVTAFHRIVEFNNICVYIFFLIFLNKHNIRYLVDQLKKLKKKKLKCWHNF